MCVRITVSLQIPSLLQVDEKAEIYFDVRLGYRNRNDPPHEWKELARSRETRPLKCTVDEEKEGNAYECEVLPLFSLGSCHYDYYLVNLRLPVDDERNINTKIGAVQDVWLVEFHQNGGFTKVSDVFLQKDSPQGSK